MDEEDTIDTTEYAAEDAYGETRQTLLEALQGDALVADAVGLLAPGVDPVDEIGLQRYTTEGDGGDSQTFDWVLSGAGITIAPGTVWADKSNLHIAGATLTLAGATEWVYVWMQRDLSVGGIDHMTEEQTSSIDHMTEEPTSSTDRILLPLAVFEGSGTTYAQKGATCHRGDFYFSQPVL